MSHAHVRMTGLTRAEAAARLAADGPTRSTKGG
jgi:hypothetical protein